MSHNHNMNNNMNMNTTHAPTNTTSHDPCHNHDGHTMLMYFHTGICEYVLFEQLKITSKGEMVAACVAVFFLALLYEGIKACREYMHSSWSRSSKAPTKSYSPDTNIVVPSKKKMLSCVHFIQTLLHAVQVFMSYCLMLVFMTFNAWLCIAIVLGAAAGYFLFGWFRSSVQDVNEHCH